MIVFPVICGLLIVLALAFVLPPLRHPHRIAAGSTTISANLAVYRRQLAEMEADLRDRIITGEQFQADRDELEQRLIADLPDGQRAGETERSVAGAGILVYLLAVALPVAAISLYLLLGTPSSVFQSP